LDMLHVWGRNMWFCWYILKERDRSEGLGVNLRIILEWIFRARAVLIRLSVGISDGLL
jgi:hypothetical protein